MLTRLSVLSVLMLLLLMGYTVQSVAAEQASQASQKNAQTADVVVCKRVVPTGSHMRRKICLRKSQWAAMTREARRVSREINDYYSIPPLSGGPVR